MALSKILENSITDGVVSSAKLKDFAAAVDLNGVELILDADQDTSITADTDDRIDFKIANTDHISIGTSSGDTVIKPMTDAKDIIFQQYDGNKILEINDGNYVGIGGNAAGAGEIRIYEDTDNGTHYTGFKAGNNTASVAYVLPTADGSASQALITDGSGTLSWSTISSAADDLTAGDAAINLTTTAGNITIDAQGNDTDIIFKGTDGGADTTYMTIDGSAGGDLFLTGGLIDLKNDGSAVSQIKFYCESSNAHAQTLIGAPHSESATNTLTLPSTGGNSYLLTAASTATVTNKTFTSPKINEDVAVTATATELNLLDGVSGLVQADLTKLAAVDSTAAELNIVDGGTSATSTTVADADRVVMNDNGTMVQVAVTDLAAYFDDEITAMPNLTSVGTLTALTVDNMAFNGNTLTTTSSDFIIDASHDIVLDADGADIVFKDGGTTIATHSNSSSDYVITTGVQDKDFVIKGDDGGSTITPLTIDMSAGGDLFLTGGLIDLKNDGSNVSQIKFYCESSNAHAQTLIGAPHSESATNTLTLPSSGGNSYLVSAASTATLTNKTLTAPVINGGVVFNEDSAAVDFRIESDDDANMFFVDGSEDKIGIGTNSPSAPLHIKKDATETALIVQSNIGGSGSAVGGQLKLRLGAGSNTGSGNDDSQSGDVLGQIMFEGATADDFETTLTVVDPTADRTITIPNETGTLITSASAATNAFSVALAAALG